jgi:hypothetical protein
VKILLPVVACGLLFSIDDGKDKKPLSDHEKIQGVWALASLVLKRVKR